jgi:hypothetical protein
MIALAITLAAFMFLCICACGLVYMVAGVADVR